MTKNVYNFKKWVNDAFLSVVKKALQTCEKSGLEDGHHFYITFYTKHPKVLLDDSLKAQYPEFMTIVLENLFEGLVVDKNGFLVVLQFNSQEQRIYVPFNSIFRFSNPKIDLALILEYEDETSFIKKKPQKDKKLKKDNIISFPSFAKKD